MRLDSDISLQTLGVAWGVDPHDFTGEFIFTSGYPEAVIIMITEHFITLTDKGLDMSEAIQAISEHFRKSPLADGTYAPAVPKGTGLLWYLRHLMDVVTRGGTPIDDIMIVAFVSEIRQFYKR